MRHQLLPALARHGARQAAVLLGHRDFATTDKHYLMVDQLEASRKITALFDGLRKKGRAGKGETARRRPAGRLMRRRGRVGPKGQVPHPALAGDAVAGTGPACGVGFLKRRAG